MTQEPEFNLESDWLEPVPAATDSSMEPQAAEPATARAAEPVVVIQYRNRGLPPVLLFPITLGVSLLLFGVYHYAFVRPITTRAEDILETRPASTSIAPHQVIPADLDETLSKVAAALAVETPALTMESQPLPLGFSPIPPVAPPVFQSSAVSSVPVDNPAPANEEPSPDSLKPDDGPLPPPADEIRPANRFSIASTGRPAASASEVVAAELGESDSSEPAIEAPAEPPLPTREEMVERIRQEDLLRQARQDEMERRKGEIAAEVAAEGRQRIENERADFRRALQQIVAAGGRDAGDEIDALCNQFGRNYSSELRGRVSAALSHYKGKFSREEEVRMLRSFGVPEPAVLDYLANRLHRSMNSRNGPRHPGEVRLYAARQLLRIKPAPIPSTTPASGGSSTSFSNDGRSQIRRTTNSAAH